MAVSVMAKKQIPNMQATAAKVTNVHFLYIAAYMLSVVVFDSWNLLTHEAVVDFWTAAGVMLVLNTMLWYLSRYRFTTDTAYRFIILALIVADIIFAAFTVYWERGLASSSVILFAVPIVTATALRSRSTLLAATALSVVAYSTATVRFFYQHYGESFRVELYGEIFLYTAVFFILAMLLLIVTHPSNNS